MEKIHYYEDLMKIRSSLEKHVSNFPKNGCFEASASVEKILGLPQIVRKYNGKHDFYDSTILMDSESSVHMLNIDKKNGLYVDLSRDQFTGKDKIYISKIDGNNEYEEDLKLNFLLKNLGYNESVLSKIIDEVENE